MRARGRWAGSAGERTGGGTACLSRRGLPARRRRGQSEGLIKAGRAAPRLPQDGRASSPGEGPPPHLPRADFKLIKSHPRDDLRAGSAALLKATQAPHKRLLRKVNNSGGRGCFLAQASWPGRGLGGGRERVGGPAESVAAAGGGLSLVWKPMCKGEQRSVGQGKLEVPLDAGASLPQGGVCCP